MKSHSALFLLLIASSVIASADQFKIPIRVQDQGGAIDTAWFGVDPGATYCIDAALGEYQLPPPGPNIDIRFTGIQGRIYCLGQGTKIDLRQFVSSTQVDTYHVQFKPGDGGYPLTISWPDLSPYYSNPVWLRNRYAPGSMNVDMKAQHSVTISDTLPLNSLFIVTGTTTSSGAAPFSLYAGGAPKQHSARLSASVNPDGDATTLWFEWGSTNDYGSVTPIIATGGGYNGVSGYYDISGLSPGTFYHFRAWAQNSFGTISAADDSFKTFLASDGPGKIVIPLQGDDMTGRSSTVYFGAWPTATYCLDPHLGEFRMWPTGPFFELRFLDSRPFSNCLHQGTIMDLRPYVSPTQIDTYKVYIASDIASEQGSYPITLSWPDLNSTYTNPVWMRDVTGGSLINIDMKAQTSFVISDTLPVSQLYIITGNGGPYIGPPFVASAAYPKSLDQTSAVLEGFASPNNVGTTAWFEWGTGASYGNSTPAESIGSGPSAVQIHAAIPGLNPRTTYHIRTVAQNSQGTSYGADNSFTTIIDGVIGEHLIPLHVADNGGAQGTYWLGVHTEATDCVDLSLGEFQLFPVPPGFDVRFIDTKCHPTKALNADFRQLNGTAQVDTYRVQFKPGDGGYPITLSWPDLGSWFNNSVRLVDPYGGLAVNEDMKSETSYQLTNDAISALLIITGTPGPGPAPPSVLTDKPSAISGSSARFNAVLNPNGAETNAWFEWGTSTDYGNSTPPNYAGWGSSTMTLSELITGLAVNGQYHYRVVAASPNGSTPGPDQAFTTGSATSVVDHPGLPKRFELFQNYPNPFNPSCTIRFALPSLSRVILRIYNPLGQMVKTVVDGMESAGIKSVTFDAGKLSSGVYFYRLQAGNFIDVKKMVLIR